MSGGRVWWNGQRGVEVGWQGGELGGGGWGMRGV